MGMSQPPIQNIDAFDVVGERLYGGARARQDFISCEYFVSEAAQGTIDTLAVKAARQGVALLLVKSMASQSN